MLAIALVLLAFTVGETQEKVQPEATSLFGKPLFAPAQTADARQTQERDLAAAEAELAKKPDSADAAIWVGRRLAYLGRYRDAVAAFTAALEKHPGDPRILRHRGHRYISVREFGKAIADLSKAATLTANRPDEVEPDGQPNAKNIPTSTLKTNIYYHLGLAHYLRADFKSAAEAYRLCMTHSKNADMQVATAHWQYMTLRRLEDQAAAARVLEPISADLPIIENGAYHKLLMMYKNPQGAEALRASLTAETRDAVTIGYGIATWDFYNGRTEAARLLLTEIVEKSEKTQWPAFGYIAAEADLARMTKKR
jgi:tetratricopeptide (TPR) repeat protein